MITGITPTPENVRGTSALPYHLLIERDPDIEVRIFSFNTNRVSEQQIRDTEKELKLAITLMKEPLWFRLVFKLHLLFVRLFLKYPLHHYIRLSKSDVEAVKAESPDVIWVYGEESSRISRQFEGFRRIHTFPDSEALFYHRMLGRRFVIRNRMKFLRCLFMYPKFLALERDMPTDNVRYHLVGEDDVAFYRENNPEADAVFIRHPHYSVNNVGRILRFHSPKIKLLIAGQYNYYMQQDADMMIRAIGREAEKLRDLYSITFLGRGWEKHVEKLENKGFEVSHITFAPDYIEEICKHDIQLTPISIGTGTKGKVLDADVIAFVSMAGNVITTRPYRGKRADIRAIPDGIYTLRSVNKKGVTHRVGMVYIRR